MLLALAPEELASKMLFITGKQGDGNFHPGQLQLDRYPKTRHTEIGLALAEAWAWLEAQGLIVPADGLNGQNGFRRLSRRARNIKTQEDFSSFKVARLLPREILHFQNRDVVWKAFMRGEYDVAVFQAMTAEADGSPKHHRRPERNQGKETPAPLPLVVRTLLKGCLAERFDDVLTQQLQSPRQINAGRTALLTLHRSRSLRSLDRFPSGQADQEDYAIGETIFRSTFQRTIKNYLRSDVFDALVKQNCAILDKLFCSIPQPYKAWSPRRRSRALADWREWDH